MYGYQALPNGERSSELIAGTEFANDGEITVAVWWKNIVENGIDVGSDAPAAGKCFRAALGVRVNGAANFGEGLRGLILAQKEISVAPGNIGGKRIGELGVVIRASVADAQVGENQAEEQGEENCGETRRDIRKAQKHSKVLCLEVFGDARLKVTCP